MEENKNPNQEKQGEQGAEGKQSLNDLLKDPKLQSEFDKKLEGAKQIWLEKAKEEWKKESEAEKNEAERLAKLTESERQKELLDKLEQAKKTAESELNAYKLKEQAQKIAKEKNLDIDLLNTIDFSKETADTVIKKIDDLDSVFKKAIENAVNEKLKQSAPKTVGTSTKDDVQAYLDKKYANSRFYQK